MAKTIGKCRKFLSNRFDEGSTVQWEVEPWAHEESCGCWAYLKIRDCDRSVRLEFDIDSEKERKQRLKKLDTLITELEKMRDCLEQAEVGNGR